MPSSPMPAFPDQVHIYNVPGTPYPPLIRPSFLIHIAIEVAEDLRKYILEIYGDFLSPDGFVSAHDTHVYVHRQYTSMLHCYGRNFVA